MAIRVFAVEREDSAWALIRFNDITGSIFTMTEDGSLSIAGRGRCMDDIREAANNPQADAYESADVVTEWAGGACEIVSAA